MQFIHNQEAALCLSAGVAGVSLSAWLAESPNKLYYTNKASRFLARLYVRICKSQQEEGIKDVIAKTIWLHYCPNNDINVTIVQGLHGQYSARYCFL